MRPGSPTMSPWSPGPRPASPTASRCAPPSWSSLSPLQATSLVGPHLDLSIKFTPSAPEVFKEDGSPWFTLFLATQSRNYKTMSETMRLYYINPETGRNEQETFLGTVIPIVPKSWYMIFFTLAKTGVPLVISNKWFVNTWWKVPHLHGAGHSVWAAEDCGQWKGCGWWREAIF